MRGRKRPEILAPAGSMESLKAAIAAGCDAVYAGGNKFGARAYADNPQEDEMIQAIRYCHLHGVKIYMTVNTLLKDRELYQELYDYMLPYYRAGLDAAIVQDVGVMRYLHRHFPRLELHASTQMTLTMGVSTRLLEKYGVTRIVPARELTLAELEQMRKDTKAELEVFVHGALCYCYSGQCLFSSMQGGRSGNRGRCAQPCRMPYQLQKKVEGVGEYLLSPKENCNLAFVGQLIEAGVDSFKIEGRMKRPEYTAFTTAIYRKYVDLYVELGKEGYASYLAEHTAQWEEDIRKLGELYNRSGFTSGYLEGEVGVPYEKRQGKGKMLSDMRPKHGGIRVGQVVSVDKYVAVYKLERDLHPQDVVEFRDNRQRPIYEYTLGETKMAGQKITARYQKGSKILPGNLVYRTKDAGLIEEIRESYLYREAKVMLSCRFIGRAEENMILEAVCYQKDGEKISVREEGCCCQKAQKQPATAEGIEKLLCQTGDTPFLMKECRVELQGELFIPVGAVKKLRRQVLARMQELLEGRGCRISMEEERKMVLEKERNDFPSLKGNHESDRRNIASVLSIEQFEAALSAESVQQIYLKMDEMTDKQLKEAVQRGNGVGKEMYLVLPAVFRQAVYETEKKKLSIRDNLYGLKDLKGFVVRNMESFVFLRDEAGIDVSRIILDSNLYTANQEACAYWQEQGCRGMTLPLELTGREMKPLSQTEGMQAVIYGHIPLMVSAQCIRYNTQDCERGKQNREKFLALQDGKKREFVVFNVCKYCYNVIYQKEPLVLAEEQETLWEQGVRYFRYDFSLESEEETSRILSGNMPAGHAGHFYSGIE
ncbi:MAG: U32 family peptidase [Lachnospiraceae bacterium]|nr:U32 family peptidase [Lachnospiraceae bacterium]